MKWSSTRSILGRGTAPSGEKNGFLALGILHCCYERAIKIMHNEIAFDTASQKIRPQKFAERRRILSESTSAPQFTRQRPERIVDKAAHRFRNIFIAAPAAFIVERMH